jgi:hypothetical protein
MCEDSDGCSDWGFKGNQGLGIWSTGAVAGLTITHLDDKSIAIHRLDTKGTGKGIEADYTGTISGYWIEGDVAASWPGHVAGVLHTKWHALLFPSQAVTANSAKTYEASLSQAQAWTLCQDFGDKCSAANPAVDSLWVLSGKAGTMQLLQDPSAQIFLYVDHLPDRGINIRRFDKTDAEGQFQDHVAGTHEESDVRQVGRNVNPYPLLFGHRHSDREVDGDHCKHAGGQVRCAELLSGRRKPGRQRLAELRRHLLLRRVRNSCGL